MLKPLLSGSIPVGQFVQTLEKVSACCVPRLNTRCHPGCCSRSPCIRDVRCFLLSVHCEQLSLKHLLGPGSQPGEKQGSQSWEKGTPSFPPSSRKPAAASPPRSSCGNEAKERPFFRPTGGTGWGRPGQRGSYPFWSFAFLPEDPLLSEHQPGHVTGDERLWAECQDREQRGHERPCCWLLGVQEAPGG